INNVGSVVQALLAAGNPDWNHEDGIEKQTAQVSIISIANSAGRILIGLSADYGKNAYNAPRSYFLVLVSSVAILSQLVLMNAEIPEHLWMTSTLLGLAYGATFGLCPVLVIEWFGLAHFSSNWGFVSFAPVISGNLFNLMFGSNLDKHAAAPQSSKPQPPAFAHLNIVGIAGNLGMYCSGPFWGRVVDSRGPRVALLIAFTLLFFGYNGIRIFYTGAIMLSDSSTAKFNGGVAALSFFGLCTGIAGNAGITSAMNAAAKSFPDRMRGSVTGTVASGFGLSAFFFSTFAHTLFPGDTAALLLILALGSSAPMLLGFFIVQPVESSHHPYEAIPAAESQLSIAEQWDSFSPVEATVEQEAIAHVRRTSRVRSESRTRRSYSAVREDLPFLIDGVNTYRGRSRSAARMSLEIPDQRTRNSQERGRSVSMHRDFIDATSIVPEDEVVDIHGMPLFKTLDFWIVFGFLSLLAGTGLIPTGRRKPGWDHKDGIERQAAQVSVISIANSAGRLLIGLGADYGKNVYDTPRSYFLILISSVGILSQLVLMNAEIPDHLWITSSLLGLAYGATFDHFSSNWGFVSLAPVMSGNLFNLMFGSNLDKHAAAPQSAPQPPTFAHVRGLPSSKELQCYDGRACYVDG
ncbi:hypothetical protein FRC07_009422, partial [Ceratobasidium sp. 392]